MKGVMKRANGEEMGAHKKRRNHRRINFMVFSCYYTSVLDLCFVSPVFHFDRTVFVLLDLSNETFLPLFYSFIILARSPPGLSSLSLVFCAGLPAVHDRLL